MPDRGGGVVQFVSFVVEERLYGLDIRVVKEINPNVAITAVPHAAPHLRGLVNIRGQVVLVIDIAVVLGRAPRPITEDSHIVIVKTTAELMRIETPWTGAQLARFGDKPTAFLVDSIRDVVTVAASSIEPVPAHLGDANAKFFDAVVRLGDHIQVILNPQELL
jgi:purine-binding chemotaxis protein CheW